MKYNFEDKTRIRIGYTGISIGVNLYITTSFFKIMNEPRYAMIRYDVKNEAIIIIPTAKKEKTAYSITHMEETAGSYVVTIPDMPKGRYYYHEKAGKGFVCVKK